jgi:ribokinase
MITVVGSTAIDMISYVPRLPRPGETLEGERFEIGFGGKGANQAVMARRLGAGVRMVACVGVDNFGDQTLANLGAEGIDTTDVSRSPAAHTGVAPIWVEPDGTNRIAIFPGANHQLVPDVVAAAVARQYSQVVVGQLEVPQAVTLAAFQAARRAGSVTVLNPAPAADVVPEVLAVTDWLVPNETEFAALAGTLLQTEVDAVTDSVLQALAARIQPQLLVTLGEAGAAMTSADGSVLRLAPPASQVVDTTGAGDAFVGAFAYGLARGLVPPDAMALAVRCASFTVGRPGTQSSFPTAQECEQLLAPHEPV